MGLFNHGLRNDRSVLQHVLEVDEVTVVLPLGEVVGVVEVDNALFMRLDDFGRKQNPLGEVLTYLACHVVPLGRVDDRVFITIFLLDLLVHLVDERKDAVVGGIGLAGELPLVAVADIKARDLIAPHLHDALFHHILNVLDVHGMGAVGHLLCDPVRNGTNLGVGHLVNVVDLVVGRLDGIDNLHLIK